MNNKPEIVDLNVGSVQIYDMGQIKILAYLTNDPLGDVVYLFVKGDRGVILEQPNFTDSIKEFEGYVKSLGIEIEGIVPSYHMPGEFMMDVPRYTTKTADDYARKGRGSQASAGFAEAFGEKFSTTLARTKHKIKDDSISIADIEFEILPNVEAFDVVIPEINTLYIHMLGHDTHSIVESLPAARKMIKTLQNHFAEGYDLVLTSHHAPETMDDILTKISYLEELVRIAKESKTPGEFTTAMKKSFPGMKKEEYLEMTAGMLFK
ncbi:MAG: hypothetical protein LBC95_00315 [Candidatus Nomurabacteria bacterium]|jgi:hypothetical protein|nr:hypothetical protein [Candidatus Nomurabacteria bacterium]